MVVIAAIWGAVWAALETNGTLPDARVHWQVWVVGELQDGKLQWRADADSQLTKVSSCQLPVLLFMSQTMPKQSGRHLGVWSV